MSEQAENELRARAESDGAVIAGLLGPSQRTRCAGTSDEDIAAGRFAAERRAVLETRPSPLPEERESAQAALDQDPGTRRLYGHSSRAARALIVVGIVFLVAGGLGILFHSLVLFILGAIGLILGGVLLMVQWFWRRLLARRQVSVLVDWAVGRDGQLARGLPPVGTVTLEGTSLWGSDVVRKIMTWTTVVGVAWLAIAVWDVWPELSRAVSAGRLPRWGDLGFDAFFLYPGLVMTPIGVAYFVGRRPLGGAAGRRQRALEWLPTSDHALPEGEGFDEDFEEGFEEGFESGFDIDTRR